MGLSKQKQAQPHKTLYKMQHTGRHRDVVVPPLQPQIILYTQKSIAICERPHIVVHVNTRTLQKDKNNPFEKHTIIHREI